MLLLKILASGAGLTKTLIISSLYYQKLYLDLDLGFGRKQSEIKRIDFIISSNVLLLMGQILFGAGEISEKNIRCLDI